MNQTYPPPPRRLERSSTDKVLGGVCSGVAHYFNLDPTLVRILTAILTITTGVPVLVYLVALFLMPEERRVGAPPAYPPVPPAVPGSWSHPSAPPVADQAVWGSEGAPWEQPVPPAGPVNRSQPTSGEAGSARRDGPAPYQG